MSQDKQTKSTIHPHIYIAAVHILLSQGLSQTAYGGRLCLR